MRIDRIKLVAELARQDMKIKQLCEITGISRATITAVKAGKACSNDTARRIAAGLGVPVSDILAKEGA